MAIGPEYRAYPGVSRAADTAAVLDAGLRAYMLRVYNWMTSGLVLTGIVAYGVVSVPMKSPSSYVNSDRIPMVSVSVVSCPRLE